MCAIFCFGLLCNVFVTMCVHNSIIRSQSEVSKNCLKARLKVNLNVAN